MVPPISLRQEFAEFVDDPMRGLWVAFSSISAFEARDISRVFHCGALHAEADAKEGHLVLASVLNCVDHSLHAAFAETAGNQDAVVAAEAGCGGSTESMSSASIHSRTVL